MTATTNRQRVLDGLAIGASTLCLIHGLLLPVLLVLLPTLAGFLTLPEEFHVAALAFVVPTSLLALVLGYHRHRWGLPIRIVAPDIAMRHG